MFSVSSYLSIDPWVGLIRAISDRTYLSLHENFCELVSLTPINTTGRTEITLKIKRSKSDANLLPSVNETMVFRFSRLRPQDYFISSGYPINISIALPTNTKEILTKITELTGVIFGKEDFESKEINSVGQSTIKVLHTSLRWYADLHINILPVSTRSLNSVVTNNSLGRVIVMPERRAGRVSGINYSLPFDFTEYRQLLRNIKVGLQENYPVDFTEMLTRVTKHRWECETAATTYNLASTVIDGKPFINVIYSGPPNLRYTSRTDVTGILVLELRETLCTNLIGRLVLHYN